jgi:hypothetical protein
MKGKLSAIVGLCGLFLLGSQNASTQEVKPDILKYSLAVKPGNLQVDKMPGPGKPKSYKESLIFTITNTTRTDYSAQLPDCKTFEVVIATVDNPGTAVAHVPAAYCHIVTNVKIAAGKSRVEKAVWDFTAADVKEGKYVATATFTSTKGTATTEFEISAVH